MTELEKLDLTELKELQTELLVLTNFHKHAYVQAMDDVRQCLKEQDRRSGLSL